MRWHAISRDPNSPEAKAFRRECLERALRDPVTDRTRHLIDQVKGKRTLDVGVVDHMEERKSERWLHGQIAASASYCLGVDILEKDIAQQFEIW